jgi:glycosyltransferase involved in cell wall biosynthesis
MAKATLITPTGDRPVAFQICEHWMRRQTFRELGDIQWIVVEDGEEETPCSMGQTHLQCPSNYSGQPRSLAQNILGAISYVEGDYVIIIEDDDWYHPKHVENLVNRLSRGAKITGNGLQQYYNLEHLVWKTFKNIGSCFCQVGFHRELLPLLEKAATECFQRNAKGLDRTFWELVPKHQWDVFLKPQHTVGMKGLPGRKGLGVGHRPDTSWTRDPKCEILYDWIGDDIQVYRDRGIIPPE